jgi:hypothetical protein
MRVSQYERAPRANVIDIFISIRVPQSRACRATDDNGIATHGAKCTHWAIYAANENIRRATKDFVRTGTLFFDLFQHAHSVALLTSSVLAMAIVARVFRRGDFLRNRQANFAISKQTLASEETSYNFCTARNEFHWFRFPEI